MTKPPDARTVLPGQPVGYHNEIDAALFSYEKTRRLDAQLIKRVGADFAGKVLDVIASPAGRQTIKEALASAASDADRFDFLRDGVQQLHEDAKRWLTESDDRPNLRAAERRIAKLASGQTDRLKIRHEPDGADAEPTATGSLSGQLDELRLALRDIPLGWLPGFGAPWWFIRLHRAACEITHEVAVPALRTRGDAHANHDPGDED